MSEVRRPTEPTPEELVEITEVTAELRDALPVLADLGRRAYNAYLPFLNATVGKGLSADEEDAAMETWNAAEKLSDLANEALAHFAPASRTFGDSGPEWYDQATDPENVALDLAARTARSGLRSVGTGESAVPSWIDMEKVVPAETVARWTNLAELAESLEPQIRALIDGYNAADGELDRLTTGMPDELGKMVEAWSGYERFADAVRVLVGHVERGTNDHPTSIWYARACAAMGITPYNPDYDPERQALQLYAENLQLKARIAEMSATG